MFFSRVRALPRPLMPVVPRGGSRVRHACFVRMLTDAGRCCLFAAASPLPRSSSTPVLTDPKPSFGPTVPWTYRAVGPCRAVPKAASMTGGNVRCVCRVLQTRPSKPQSPSPSPSPNRRRRRHSHRAAAHPTTTTTTTTTTTPINPPRPPARPPNRLRRHHHRHGGRPTATTTTRTTSHSALSPRQPSPQRCRRPPPPGMPALLAGAQGCPHVPAGASSRCTVRRCCRRFASLVIARGSVGCAESGGN